MADQIETVYLFEFPRFAWTDVDAGVEWDSDAESLVNSAGDEVSLAGAVAAGAMEIYWDTKTVFATDCAATDWGNAKSYNYPNGWRVRGVPMVGWPARVPHPGRTHERLRRDITTDPIFLGQRLKALDHGVEPSESWVTECVFLTRADGEAWLEDLGPRTTKASDRVYCVHATGALCAALAAATVEGRYR